MFSFSLNRLFDIDDREVIFFGCLGCGTKMRMYYRDQLAHPGFRCKLPHLSHFKYTQATGFLFIKQEFGTIPSDVEGEGGLDRLFRCDDWLICFLVVREYLSRLI